MQRGEAMKRPSATTGSLRAVWSSLILASVLLCGAVSHANAALIILDETLAGESHNFPAGSGLTPGNVWLCEPTSTALTPTGCIVSDLAHFFTTVGGVDTVILISDQDPTPPPAGPTIDDPADQLGFGTNVPALGDVFLAEAAFKCGFLGLSTCVGAAYAPAAGPGSDVFGDTYELRSNCSDCTIPEPSSALLSGTALLSLLFLSWKSARRG